MDTAPGDLSTVRHCAGPTKCRSAPHGCFAKVALFHRAELSAQANVGKAPTIVRH